MKTIRLIIDGKSVTCPPDTSVLQVAEENSIYIPTLCNHHELKPHGACRICIVEDKTSGYATRTVKKQICTFFGIP